MVGDVQIARDNEFQMTKAAERKEREQEVSAGWSRGKKLLV